jgi:cell division protein FtsW
MQPSGQNTVDMPLLTATLLLLFSGLVMVYSSSSFMAEQRYDTQYYFLTRQAGAMLVGLGALWLFSRIHYKTLEKLALPFLLFSGLLLVAVLIPGLGVKAGGAKRWLHLPGFNFQPVEIAKLAVIIYAAKFLSRQGDGIRNFVAGVLPMILLAGLFVVLLLCQPDFGSAATMIALMTILLFVAGTKLSYLAYAALATLPVLTALVAFSDYRRSRILAFLNPWSVRSDSGYQIVQSFLAFGAGGWNGAGLGDGRQKLLYLPEAHTDFIFSVIGEELGLIGVVIIVALYSLLIWRGIRIAMNAPDHFGAFLALGITSLFGIQAIVNMGVVMGMLPTKGLTLPLVSYGGSSVLASLAGIGILLAIGAQSPAARR